MNPSDFELLACAYQYPYPHDAIHYLKNAKNYQLTVSVDEWDEAVRKLTVDSVMFVDMVFKKRKSILDMLCDADIKKVLSPNKLELFTLFELFTAGLSTVAQYIINGRGKRASEEYAAKIASTASAKTVVPAAKAPSETACLPKKGVTAAELEALGFDSHEAGLIRRTPGITLDDLRTKTEAELVRLNGIGPKTAERILEIFAKAEKKNEAKEAPAVPDAVQESLFNTSSKSEPPRDLEKHTPVANYATEKEPNDQRNVECSCDEHCSPIRDARKRMGLTLDDLASLAGMDVSLLAQIEDGKTIPSAPRLLEIAFALGTDMISLMDKSWIHPDSSVYGGALDLVAEMRDNVEKQFAENGIKILDYGKDGVETMRAGGLVSAVVGKETVLIRFVGSIAKDTNSFARIVSDQGDRAVPAQATHEGDITKYAVCICEESLPSRADISKVVHDLALECPYEYTVLVYSKVLERVVDEIVMIPRSKALLLKNAGRQDDITYATWMRAIKG